MNIQNTLTTVETNNQTTPPAYKEIFEQIGKQLNLRKSALVKRILLITWPYILLVVAMYFLNFRYDLENLSLEQTITLLKFFVPYLVLSIFYSAVIRFIFKIEKQIWVDSFFDKKNLDPSQSWRIARKLFWPAFSFRLKLWLQFYFVPIAIIIALFAVGIWLSVPVFNSTRGYETILFTTLISLFVFVIGLIVYGYYLKTKLRYTYFIFLDTFGQNESYKTILAEMKKLNGVSKSETFKKSLLIHIGADSLKSIAQIAVQSISHGVGQFGAAGKLIGNVMRIYGEEASRQATDLANISAQYILYRFARKEMYGTEQQINERVYNL